MDILEIVWRLFLSTGIAAMTIQEGIMLVVSFVFLYLALVKKFEPLLLVPIAFGMLLANLPNVGIMFDATAYGLPWYESGVLRLMYGGVRSSLFPVLIFLGIGAMIDFGPLLSNPSSLILALAAQVGLYMTFIIAGVINIGGIYFTPGEAAAISIIGSADGPTTIFLATQLAPHLLAPVALAAYSYMALIPLIQPPIMRLMTTEKERKIKMSQLRKVSKAEKIVFPIFVTVICGLLLPDIVPLLGMLMLGNLFREAGCVERLSDTSQNALCNIVTIMLGLAVGASAEGMLFLRPHTLFIIGLGLAAFMLSTATAMLGGKILCAMTGGKINPLIGSSAVSAIPIAARVSNSEGLKADPRNFLLMHAMGPNVAGVIATAVVAGMFLVLFGN